MKPLLLSLLLPLTSLAQNGGYFATPGAIMEVQGFSTTPIYSFCPDAPACKDGASPLPVLFTQADGSLLGVASRGGEGRAGEGGPGGVVFTLTPGPHGSWAYTKVDLCLFWMDCSHFGFPVAVNSPKPGVLDIVFCQNDCKKGARVHFVLHRRAPDGSPKYSILQTWSGEEE